MRLQKHLRRAVETTGGLVLVLIMGGLVVLAAPKSGTFHVVSRTVPTTTASSMSQLAAITQATPTPAPTTPPKPIHHTQASQNATPSMAAATPTPTATAPLGPSWHIIGTYSGSTAESLGTITVSGPLRITYTCGAGWGVQFAFQAVPSDPDPGAAFTMATGICTAGQTSGTLNTGQPTFSGPIVYQFAVSAYYDNGIGGIGPWTATLADYN